MKLSQKTLQSPFALAFLVGLFPSLFLISNNWFLFHVSRSVLIVGSVTLIIFVVMGSYYWVLSKVSKSLLKNLPAGMVQRLYVFTSMVVFAYLLRWPLLEWMAYEFSSIIILFFIIAIIALVMAWFEPKMQTFRLNIFIIILSISSLGSTLYSVISTGATESIGRLANESDQAPYRQLAFRDTPNVYYIEPDGYPNREALEKIFSLDNTKFYRNLKSSGFTTYYSAYSNYGFTIASIASLFSMSHHYYEGYVGISELLNARAFISGKQNPVIHIFKNNGYQVDFIHQRGGFFSQGCFVDLCSPSSGFWDEVIDIIVPNRLQSILHLETYNSLDRLEGRLLKHLDRIAADNRPHFVRVHMDVPNHSGRILQVGSRVSRTVEELESFRKDYYQQIQLANDSIMKLVQEIVTRDPNALIVINSDHGARGLGALVYSDKRVFDGVPDDLIALDHLGVHLSIRWPGDASEYDQEIKTRVNLFRYIFAFLSKSEDILATKAPDHGFIRSEKSEAAIVFKVVHDGEVLEQMVEMK